MTNEKILEMLYNALKVYPENELTTEGCLNVVRMYDGKPEKSGTFNTCNVKIATLIYALENENKAKTAKKAGKSDLLQAAKNILKNAKKKLEYKTDFHTAFISDGKQVFCDGYRALILSGTKTLDLETNNKEVMNIKAMTPDTFKYAIKLPKYIDFKTELTRFKNLYKKTDIIVRFLDVDNNPLIAFNADYLLDGLKINPDYNVLRYNAHNKTAGLTADNVTMLICPVTLNSRYKTTSGERHYIDIDLNGDICITTETTNKEIA